MSLEKLRKVVEDAYREYADAKPGKRHREWQAYITVRESYIREVCERDGVKYKTLSEGIVRFTKPNEG